ncbi:alpha/beta fold hydrolase [Flavihumibacter stibioxidans]|uniref:AB hydrolase-1 domain-containing protein n=1 Tax=Flavihumibacter stibioxidans TaxID=1834163 RepID=A0ABR7MBX9_9BACT|nr:alpha/beta hydrolase [Flavihumibacter stibioxidans]MBC6492543.1 hypothetical protein [Flavihumibacter stibioxidans]
MKVYFIPGLGADKRVFSHIRLPEGYEIVHLDWLSPEPDESLPHYAERLGAQIDREAPWSLVGLSFGGMLATEISRIYQPETTIVIASITSPAQLPTYYKLAAPLNLHKILPVGIFKNASLARRIFTTETSEDKDLLRRIISESDPGFIRWALGAILNWKSMATATGIFHIHGSGDHLLPVKYVYPTHLINGGGHLMVMNRAEEVNRVLGEILHLRSQN